MIFVVLFILIAVVQREEAIPLPSHGVRLFLSHQWISLPNHSMIPAEAFYNEDVNGDGFDDALWCQSSLNDFDIGRWYYPNGWPIDTNYAYDPVISKSRFGQTGLYRQAVNFNEDGLYKCVIYDDNYIEQTLIIGIYDRDTYNAFKGPVILDYHYQFDLLSSRNARPTKWAVSFTVIDGTATYINCSINGDTLTPTINREVLSYKLPTKIAVSMIFNSRQSGWYNCSISNSRVEDKTRNGIVNPTNVDFKIKVTKKPTDVKIIWLNDSSAEVNWLPPLYTDVEDALVSGYEVFYETKSDAYVMSSGITRDTKVIINVKRNLLFGNFHVVAFTNQPFVLPSELAITGDSESLPYLISNNLKFCDIKSTLLFDNPLNIVLICCIGFLISSNFTTILLFILRSTWTCCNKKRTQQIDKTTTQLDQ